MKIICIGRNYVKHIEELKNEIPDRPAVFLKPETALLIPGEDFHYPSFSKDIHHEVELVLEIGKHGSNIPNTEALKYISHITTGIDFTARDLQDYLKEKRLSWELSKAFDGAAAIGRFLPFSDFSKSANLNFSLDINGETVQRGNTSKMIFSFEKIISFVSTYFTLEPGDLIYTGTPEGVGPVKRGDVLTAYLEDFCLLELKII
jgi:2-keto-4-pentenoate hydratase/2-oxohepta-3-ene-1,7-dioic acid hydratase in catechol pathway